MINCNYSHYCYLVSIIRHLDFPQGTNDHLLKFESVMSDPLFTIYSFAVCAERESGFFFFCLLLPFPKSLFFITQLLYMTKSKFLLH